MAMELLWRSGRVGFEGDDVWMRSLANGSLIIDDAEALFRFVSRWSHEI